MPRRKTAKRKIAVLCGGISSEREVSLRSGAEVFKYLDRKRFIPSLIEIRKDRKCVVRKTEIARRPATKPFGIPPHGNLGELKKYADIVFIGLHGTFGEDGRIQAILETVGIPYTGSGVLASALAMDKEKTQAFLEGKGIPMPKTTVVTRGFRSFSSLPVPCVVKPNASGSSVGVTIVRSRSQLARAVRAALKKDATVLVQEYIRGREFACGVLGNADHPRLCRALLPIEIIADGTFFDYRAKYHSEKTQEICPAQISPALTKKIQALSLRAHVLLGCRGLTRSDFILQSSTPVFLELNTLPGLTAQSLCPKEAATAGESMTDFLTRQIEFAYK